MVMMFQDRLICMQETGLRLWAPRESNRSCSVLQKAAHLPVDAQDLKLENHYIAYPGFSESAVSKFIPDRSSRLTISIWLQLVSLRNPRLWPQKTANGWRCHQSWGSHSGNKLIWVRNTKAKSCCKLPKKAKRSSDETWFPPDFCPTMAFPDACDSKGILSHHQGSLKNCPCCDISDA